MVFGRTPAGTHRTDTKGIHGMALGDFLARLGGRTEHAEGQPAPTEADRPPTADALHEALAETERLVQGGAVPSPVTARVQRVTATVRDTIPRLDAFGSGSDRAYAVMATATDYLPEAVGGYLRLPRRFADTRPVDGPKTALMVLVDQLDLLGATMDAVFDAVCRDDANALVAHGRFLTEKFGSRSHGGDLELGEIALPAMPAGSPESAEPVTPVGPAVTTTGQPEAEAPSSPAETDSTPAQPPSSAKPSSPAPAADPAPLRPPSSLDL